MTTWSSRPGRTLRMTICCPTRNPFVLWIPYNSTLFCDQKRWDFTQNHEKYKNDKWTNPRAFICFVCSFWVALWLGNPNTSTLEREIRDKIKWEHVPTFLFPHCMRCVPRRSDAHVFAECAPMLPDRNPSFFPALRNSSGEKFSKFWKRFFSEFDEKMEKINNYRKFTEIIWE